MKISIIDNTTTTATTSSIPNKNKKTKETSPPPPPPQEENNYNRNYAFIQQQQNQHVVNISTSNHATNKNINNTTTSFISKTTNDNTFTATNNTSTPKTQVRRIMIPSSLQQSFDKGGLILFIHIPKTGGSTIRLNIEKKLNSTVDYYFVSGKGIYDAIIPLVTKYVSYGIQRKRYWRKPIFLEIHGRDSPSLLQLHHKLLNLRKMARTNGIPIYFFTLFRNPIDYQISYFNFFHVQYSKYHKNPTRHFPQVDATEENLLHFALYNPQCQFLSRGEFSLRNHTTKQIVTSDECNLVYTALNETMDWVGTTDKLDIEIVPILRHVLNLPSNFTFDRHLVAGAGTSSSSSSSSNNNKNGINLKISKKESISYQQLNQSTISTINSMNQLDMELYDKLQEEFTFTKH